MKITIFYERAENGKREYVPVDFEGTLAECKMAQEWPSYAATPDGQNMIRRFAADPALQAWETFCCGGG